MAAMIMQDARLQKVNLPGQNCHLVYKLMKGIGQVLFRQDLQMLLQMLCNQVLYLALIQGLRPDALGQGSLI